MFLKEHSKFLNDKTCDFLKLLSIRLSIDIKFETSAFYIVAHTTTTS